MVRPVAVALVCASLLTACASRGQDSGVAGANPGIVVGSQVAAGGGEPPVGAVEGALIGADVGRSLTEHDRKVASKAEYEALEYGQPGRPMSWQGGRSGNHGEIAVGSIYQVNRLDCREYTHRVFIGGRPRVARGTACRQPDGVWRIVG